MVGKQEYPFKQTLKEARSKEICVTNFIQLVPPQPVD